MKVGSDIIYLGRGTENFGGGWVKKSLILKRQKRTKKFQPPKRREKVWIGIKSRINYQHHFSGTIETPAEDIVEGYSGLLYPPCALLHSGGRISRPPPLFFFFFLINSSPGFQGVFREKKIFIFTRISRKKSTHERKNLGFSYQNVSSVWNSGENTTVSRAVSGIPDLLHVEA